MGFLAVLQDPRYDPEGYAMSPDELVRVGDTRRYSRLPLV